MRGGAHASADAFGGSATNPGVERTVPAGRTLLPCASIADTAARIGGQFIAASSNMLVYCEPCPEKSAATRPVVSRPAARKWAPCLGRLHLASCPCERSRAATAPSTPMACSAFAATKPTRGCAAGVSRLRAYILAKDAKDSATARFSAEKAPPRYTSPRAWASAESRGRPSALASAVATTAIIWVRAASHLEASAAHDGALSSST